MDFVDFVTTTVSVTRFVVFGGCVSTTGAVTEPPFPVPEPEPESDPLEPEPPSMGTTEYDALGASSCNLDGRCSLTGKDRHFVTKTERRRVTVLRCILSLCFQDAGARSKGVTQQDLGQQRMFRDAEGMQRARRVEKMRNMTQPKK